MGPPDPTGDDIELALGAEGQLRDAVGDEITDTIVAVLTHHLARPGDTGPRRCLATVLFMDVVGSTDLLRDRDPDETMGCTSRHWRSATTSDRPVWPTGYEQGSLGPVSSRAMSRGR